jgi:rhodanese-related sulfurtransferase
MTDIAAVPELTVKEAAELITGGRAVVVDVNPRKRWSSGHIPGALNLDAAEFVETDIPDGKEATLIFYCSEGAGSLSRFAARRALKLGFVHVFLLPAGLKGWMAAGHRAMAGR